MLSLLYQGMEAERMATYATSKWSSIASTPFYIILIIFGILGGVVSGLMIYKFKTTPTTNEPSTPFGGGAFIEYLMHHNFIKAGEISTDFVNLLSEFNKKFGSKAKYDIGWFLCLGTNHKLFNDIFFPQEERIILKGKAMECYIYRNGIALCPFIKDITKIVKAARIYRSKRPIDGLILNISVKEIQENTNEVFLNYVKNINEAQYESGMILPVSIIITDIEELEGFSQAFQEKDDTFMGYINNNDSWYFDEIFSNIVQNIIDKIIFTNGRLIEGFDFIASIYKIEANMRNFLSYIKNIQNLKLQGIYFIAYQVDGNWINNITTSKLQQNLISPSILFGRDIFYKKIFREFFLAIPSKEAYFYYSKARKLVWGTGYIGAFFMSVIGYSYLSNVNFLTEELSKSAKLAYASLESTTFNNRADWIQTIPLHHPRRLCSAIVPLSLFSGLPQIFTTFLQHVYSELILRPAGEKILDPIFIQEIENKDQFNTQDLLILVTKINEITTDIHAYNDLSDRHKLFLEANDYVPSINVGPYIGRIHEIFSNAYEKFIAYQFSAKLNEMLIIIDNSVKLFEERMKDSNTIYTTQNLLDLKFNLEKFLQFINNREFLGTNNSLQKLFDDISECPLLGREMSLKFQDTFNKAKKEFLYNLNAPHLFVVEEDRHVPSDYVILLYNNVNKFANESFMKIVSRETNFPELQPNELCMFDLELLQKAAKAAIVFANFTQNNQKYNELFFIVFKSLALEQIQQNVANIFIKSVQKITPKTTNEITGVIDQFKSAMPTLDIIYDFMHHNSVLFKEFMYVYVNNIFGNFDNIWIKDNVFTTIEKGISNWTTGDIYEAAGFKNKEEMSDMISNTKENLGRLSKELSVIADFSKKYDIDPLYANHWLIDNFDNSDSIERISKFLTEDLGDIIPYDCATKEFVNTPSDNVDPIQNTHKNIIALITDTCTHNGEIACIKSYRYLIKLFDMYLKKYAPFAHGKNILPIENLNNFLQKFNQTDLIVQSVQYFLKNLHNINDIITFLSDLSAAIKCLNTAQGNNINLAFDFKDFQKSAKLRTNIKNIIIKTSNAQIDMYSKNKTITINNEDNIRVTIKWAEKSSVTPVSSRNYIVRDNDVIFNFKGPNGLIQLIAKHANTNSTLKFDLQYLTAQNERENGHISINTKVNNQEIPNFPKNAPKIVSRETH